MTDASEKINLLNLDSQAMRDFIQSLGHKPFHAQQLLKWIHRHGVTDFSEMSDLSKKLRDQLTQVAEIRAPEIILEQPSEDGTSKWILQLDCNNRIETVLIPEKNRNTLCVSSQVGCALDCSFCSTAQQGFNRNLSVAEIIGQVWVAARKLGDDSLTNIVMMGMGEPLANFDSVVQAMELMQHDYTYGLSKHRVTLSTSGIVPNIYRLREKMDVALAVSLHAANDELRNQLVPINKKYPLDELIAACRDYFKNDKRRKVTFEYVMLAGINDSDKHCKELIRLMEKVPSKVNLIPFNPFPGTAYESSSVERIESFRQRLKRSGFVATTRKTRGEKIAAACGQLVGQVKDKSRRTSRRDGKLVYVGNPK